jgi:hypothetical protein
MVRGSALCIGRIRSLHLRELSMHASCSTVYRATQFCPSELSPKILRRVSFETCCALQHGRSVFDSHRHRTT